MSTPKATPLISVIIPTYNCALYLPQAIKSVLAQSYRPLEIIVVDDGSTDDTAERLRPYLSHIQLRQQSNQGPSAARNVGLNLAKGEFIAFLDADDWFLPDKLSQQATQLRQDPQLGIKPQWLAVRCNGWEPGVPGIWPKVWIG